jgi:hypothetical protein
MGMKDKSQEQSGRPSQGRNKPERAGEQSQQRGRHRDMDEDMERERMRREEEDRLNQDYDI